MDKLAFPAEFKAAGDTGTFEGYASVFGNIDQGYDVIERGAFKEIMKNAAGKVVTLWQHNSRQPIGVSDVKQDDKGLAFTGHLVMEDPLARTALAHMKAGSVSGMSIGFDILPGGADFTEGGVRILKELKLWEISAVTFPMNELATITGAKGLKQLTNIRDYEDFLREAGGFSREQARILARAYKDLPGRRDADGGADEPAVKGFVSFLESISKTSTI